MANVLSIVSYKIFPAKLGGQKGIALFYKYLSELQNIVMVTVEENDPAFAHYTVLNVFSNSFFRYINIFYFFKIRRIIRKHQISHIIIEHPYYGWLGLLLKWFCGVKMIIHSHNIESLRFRTIGKWWWRILWRYEYLVHNHADLTFCITEDDRQYMIRNFKIKPERLTVITYGIELNMPPLQSIRDIASRSLREKHHISGNAKLFLFNGTLNYQPNLDAVNNILDTINPAFQTFGMPYKIIICGKGLPSSMNNLKAFENNNIIYAGFVEDISEYFYGVDVFINPVMDGGGIKTKLVEALASDLNAVSCRSGSIGVDPELCNGKLLLSEDGDWHGFVSQMLEAAKVKKDIPATFFDTFYWGGIARKASGHITM